MIKFKKIISLIIMLGILVPHFSYADNVVLNEHSKSAIMIDQDTNRVLYEKNADEKRPIASLTKMMTFLIAVESIEKNKVGENDLVNIDKEVASIKGSTCRLQEGEQVELKELMKGLMLVSGNDAALAISKHIGGSEEEFIKLMNNKAKQIGMTNTYFISVNGLPLYKDPLHEIPPDENISTARDVALLGKYMFDNYKNQVTEITTIRTCTDEARKFTYCNTNPLLVEVPGVDGIKTGYTDKAGYCLSFSMVVNQDQRNEKAHRLIGVVLGTGNKDDRKISASSILKYGREGFYIKKISTKNQVIGMADVDKIKGLQLEVKASDDIYAVLKNGESFNSKIEIQADKIKFPIKDGDEIGTVKYYNDAGEVIQTGKVINNTDSKEISFGLKLKILYRSIINFFNK